MMEKRFDHDLEKAMDEAIMFLSKAFSKSGRNSKPVIMHSIRTGMELFNRGYSKDIVLAGLLHDILEDTDCSKEHLEEAFGSRIASLVDAATFDRSIPGKRERNLDVFLRCRKLGFDALIVKCADILDNIDYFTPTPGYEDLCEMLMQKYHDFLDISRDMIGSEPLFADLETKVRHAEQLMAAFKTR